MLSCFLSVLAAFQHEIFVFYDNTNSVSPATTKGNCQSAAVLHTCSEGHSLSTRYEKKNPEHCVSLADCISLEHGEALHWTGRGGEKKEKHIPHYTWEGRAVESCPHVLFRRGLFHLESKWPACSFSLSTGLHAVAERQPASRERERERERESERERERERESERERERERSVT